MRRLDQFQGFQIKSQTQKDLFNPFFTEIHSEPKRTEDVVQMIAKGNARLENLLDAEPRLPEVAGETPHLFPKAPEKPVEPIPETSFVPMIQPRNKDGERLLYKHPNLPRVGVRGEYWLLVGHSDRSQAAKWNWKTRRAGSGFPVIIAAATATIRSWCRLVAGS